MSYKKWPDWDCPQCGYSNFGSRSECNDCGCFRSKAFKNDSKKKEKENKKKGDWTCSCGELNFASRSECRKCQKIKACFVTGITIIENAPSLVPSTDVKPGDWLCPKCSINNFGTRVVCFKCSAPRNVGPQSEQQTNSTPTTTPVQPTPLDEKDECVVCFERQKDTVITVCGHLGYCGVCALTLKNCPICRKQYDPKKDLLKVYKI